MMANNSGDDSSPLPFRGGAGGGGSPADAALADSPHPNPSPEGEGLDRFDPAAARFAVLQLVRLSGALLALAGVLVISGKIGWLPKLPEAVGYVLVGAGLIDFFVLPPLLAKRWKSQP